MIAKLPRSLSLLACLLVLGCGPVSAGEREEWQPPQQIMDAVGVVPGMTIGEVGAGEGYLTFYLAERVGKAGKVYANEISSSDLASIRRRAAKEGVDNIETVLGQVEDPLFPETGLDMVIMVYVLHHMEQPVAFLQHLPAYLGREAPLVIIERDTSIDRDHDDHHSFMSGSQVLETAQAAGYVLVRTETLPRDTIYIFQAQAP